MESNNFDVNEVKKFSNLAEQWWDFNGDMKMLHKINPLRLKVIYNAVALFNKNILDVGCGGGILSESMAKLGGNVTGIDLSSKSIEIAKIHAQQNNLKIDYRVNSIESMIETNNISMLESFDVIVCMEMLEHVPDPYTIVQSCVKLLKPGGHIFFSTINRNFKSYICAILIAEYILNILPKGTHSYNKLIKPQELAEWGVTNGLVFENIKSFTYNPLTRRFSLKDGENINYIISFIKK